MRIWTGAANRGSAVETNWARIVTPIGPPEHPVLRGLEQLGAQACAFLSDIEASGAPGEIQVVIAESLGGLLPELPVLPRLVVFYSPSRPLGRSRCARIL